MVTQSEKVVMVTHRIPIIIQPHVLQHDKGSIGLGAAAAHHVPLWVVQNNVVVIVIWLKEATWLQACLYYRTMSEVPITIQRVLMIKGGGCKRDGWIIGDVEVIDGVDFITLSKKDHGFSRFVSGSVGGIRDMTFLDTFRRLRSEASLAFASGSNPEESLFDAAPVTNRKARKAKRAEVQDLIDKGDANRTVPVELPEIALDDGFLIPGMTVQCKTAINLQDNVVVALTTEMLTYVRHAMNKSFEAQSRKRSASGEAIGVYWKSQKCGWLATRKSEGKISYKTFRCDKDCNDIEKEEVRERAIRWSNGDDQVGEDDDFADEVDEEDNAQHAASEEQTQAEDCRLSDADGPGDSLTTADSL